MSPYGSHVFRTCPWVFYDIALSISTIFLFLQLIITQQLVKSISAHAYQVHYQLDHKQSLSRLIGSCLATSFNPEEEGGRRSL